jgi:predicted transcriptional regulator
LDGTRHPVAKRPGIDEPYLLPGDLEVDGETVDVETAMDARQEYEVPSDIRFEPSGMENIQTTTNIQNLDDKEAQEWQEAAEKWGVPKELQEWRNMPDETRENMLDILRVVSSNEVTKYKEISDRTGISISAISDYKGNTKQLGLCLKKTDDSLYVLTPVGEKALEANWQKVV